MRENNIAEGMRWLKQAQEDLYWAQHLHQEGGYHLVCFLAQQVTEKALKAILYAQGEEIVLGHSVVRLGAQVSVYFPSLQQKLSSWSILDGYYIPTRYPNGLPDGIPADVYTKSASSQAVQLAGEAVSLANQYLTKSSD